MYILPETELIRIVATTPEKESGKFVIEPLSPGYGVTLGNSLRRVLLSSLEGAAVTSIRCEGVTHEFSTLKGMREDIIEFILNLKTLRVKIHGSDPVVLNLEKKGPAEIKASDFEKNPEVEMADSNHYLATLDKGGSLKCQVMIERGRGYLPVEKRTGEKRPLGTILIDAVFTPIRKVHYEVENTRVEGITNFDKLTIEITTDGTISAAKSLNIATQILQDHIGLLKGATEPREPKKQKEVPQAVEPKKKKTAEKKVKPSVSAKGKETKPKSKTKK